MIDTLLLGLMGISLTFGQLGRISLGNGIQFYILELIILIHTGVLLYRARGKLHVPHTLLFRIGAAWFVYIILLFVVTALGKDLMDNIKAGMYIVRLGVFALYFGLLAHTRIQKTFITKVLTVISFAIPAVCLLQYMVVPDLRFLAGYGWDPHMYRAVGVIFDPPITGVVLGVLFFVATVRKDKIAQFLNFFAIVMLFSRSTYLAVLFVIIAYFVSQRKYLYGFVWVALFVLAVYIAPKTIPPYLVLESAKIERISTVMSRRVEIEHGLRAWVAHPVFGIGFNRVAEYKKSLEKAYGDNVQSNHSSSAFHSFWLTQLATTGIIGFALLAAAYGLVMKRGFYWVLALSIPGLVGLLDNVVFHPFVLTLFILVFFSRVLDRPHSPHTTSSA